MCASYSEFLYLKTGLHILLENCGLTLNIENIDFHQLDAIIVYIHLSMLHSREFYKQLGNLFYAIAAADKKISKEERKTLDDEIQFAWKHYEDSKDRFGSDRAFLIQFEFETMEDEYESPGNAFESFVGFYKDNEAAFDPDTKRRVFNSARHIAESMRRINKQELELLVKLKELMKI